MNVLKWMSFFVTVTFGYAWQPFQKELTTIRACDDILRHIKKRHVHIPSPPYMGGKWASKSCEIRSGPDFLLRKYSFDNTTTVFEARQYFYSDSDCMTPSHLIVARGSFRPPKEQWFMPHFTEMNYQLSHVSVLPYTLDAARRLSRLVNRTCPGTVVLPWRTLKHYEIFKFNEFEDRIGGNMFLDLDCTAALNFSLHELQLFRMEIIKHHHHELKELYLGDVHTSPGLRHTHRPTSFQAPLIEMKNHGCGGTCRALSKSTDISPPKLRKTHVIRARRLHGEWVSIGCESQPNGLFLTRKIKFEPGNSTWIGQYFYASDHTCKHPTFTLKASGYYYHESSSNVLQHAENYKFRVEKLTVKSLDESVTNNLNDGHGCGLNKWKINTEQDVTVTKGCITLGIKLPHIEFEIVKLEKNIHGYLLSLGERPSDGGSPTSPRERATSFQPPMLRCNYEETKGRSMENESKYWARTATGGSSYPVSSLCLIIASLFLFSC